MKEVNEAFRNELGDPEVVLSIAAMGFLLILTPQVQMGLGTLRSVLFDTYLATRLTPAQRLAYRVIETKSHWDLPWSRRGTLQRELSRTLYEQARLRGQPVAKLKEKFNRSDDAEFSVQVISATLEKMAISPKSTEEIQKLRQRVKNLEEELEIERMSPKAEKAPVKAKQKRAHRRTI